jgi:hypothetical protein
MIEAIFVGFRLCGKETRRAPEESEVRYINIYIYININRYIHILDMISYGKQETRGK